jgi:hypothetical protein
MRKKSAGTRTDTTKTRGAFRGTKGSNPACFHRRVQCEPDLWTEFASDSPQEGDGFEPSVPRREQHFSRPPFERLGPRFRERGARSRRKGEAPSGARYMGFACLQPGSAPPSLPSAEAMPKITWLRPRLGIPARTNGACQIRDHHEYRFPSPSSTGCHRESARCRRRHQHRSCAIEFREQPL